MRLPAPTSPRAKVQFRLSSARASAAFFSTATLSRTGSKLTISTFRRARSAAPSFAVVSRMASMSIGQTNWHEV
jgi:hypothetical protein